MLLTSENRPALIVLLGGEAPEASFRGIAALADKIIAAFGTTSADDFLASITDYDPREKKITAIKDLRDAIRFGKVGGTDGLRECKDAVESWIARNPAPVNDPWANVSRESQYGYGDSYYDDEPPF